MANLDIYYRKFGTSKYIWITQCVDTSQGYFINWDRNISNKLYEFTINLYNPVDLDGNEIEPDNGDEIVIVENSIGVPWEVFNNTFIGIIEKSEESLKGLKDESESNFNTYYNLLIRNKNFSTTEKTIEITSNQNLSTILNQIFSTVTELGGERYGITIPKYYISAPDIEIPPFKYIGSELDCLVKILNLVGYTFYFYYYLDPDTTNNLKIVKQIFIEDSINFNPSPSQDWNNGINFNSLKNGIIEDVSLKDEYIVTEDIRTFKKIKDSRNLRNYLKLLFHVKNQTETGLKRYTELGSDKDTFFIGKSWDIKYVGISIFDTIVTVNSSTSFEIHITQANDIAYYENRMNNNNLNSSLVCRIVSGPNEYFRTFLLSGTTILLSEPIISLSAGDVFELVNCFDILKENLLSYPGDNTGFVIKSISENSSIKFTDLDKPAPDKTVVIYHYPIENSFYSDVYVSNIAKFGFRGKPEEISYTISEEQKQLLIDQYLKYTEPLEEYHLTTHRKTILNVNTKVKVNYKNTNKNFIVTESSGKVIVDDGLYKDKPLIVQEVILSSYKDNLSDLLAKLETDSELFQSNSLETIVNEVIYFELSYDDVLDEISELILTAYNATNITSNGFTARWYHDGSHGYIIQVSNDVSFSSILYFEEVIGSFILGNTITNEMNFSLSSNVYYRVRSINSENQYTGTSNTISVILSSSNYRNYITDSNTIVYYDFQNTLLNKILSSTHILNNSNGLFKTRPYIIDDQYNFSLTKENSYAYITNHSIFNTNEFTYRMTFYIDSLNSENVIISRFDTQSNVINAQFYLAWNSTYGLWIGLYDVSYENNSNSIHSTYYQNSSITLKEKECYQIQFSYKESTRELLVILNGKEITMTRFLTSSGTKDLSNITLKTTLSARVLLGIAFDNSGEVGKSNIKILRFAYDTRFRTLSEAKTDWEKIFYREFPSSITGDWGTLNLNYGYIFNPKYIGDLTDKSGNNNTSSLIRRNSGDNYPVWDTEKGLVNLDFSSSDFSAVQVNDDTSLDLGSEFTLVLINKKLNTNYAMVVYKWNYSDANLNSYLLLITDKIENTFKADNILGSSGIWDNYSDITPSNKIYIYSVSEKVTTQEITIVRDQITSAVNNGLYNNMPSGVNKVHDLRGYNLYLGNSPDFTTSDPYTDWQFANNNNGLKLFSFAIIKNKLSEAQIKKLHELMGFKENKLKVHLTFENSVNDQSIYDNNGTNHGGTFSTPIAPNYSNSLILDGTNDYVDIPSDSSMTSNKFACSLAFNFISIQNANLQNLFNKYRQEGINGKQFFLDYYGNFGDSTYNYKIRIVIYDSSNSNALLYLVPYSFDLNTDYLITLTYKQKTGIETESTLKLYINGTEVSFSGAGFVDQSSTNLSNLTYGSTTQNGVLGIGGYLGGSDVINDGLDLFPNIAIQDFRYKTEFMTLSEHQALNSEIFGV